MQVYSLFGVVDLCEPRLDVPAQVSEAKMGIEAAELRRASHRRRSDHRAFGQRLQASIG